MTSSVKIGIIGGGLVGSYAAYLASLKKISATVFERTPKQTWLRHPLSTRRCGEGVWKQKLEKAGLYFSLETPPDYVEGATDTLLLGHLKGKSIHFLKGKIDPYLFLDRQKMEISFYQKALDQGTIWHFGKGVDDYDVWQKENKFDLVLGFWGTNPRLTSQVTRKTYHQEYGLTCQYTFSDVDASKIADAKTIIFVDNPLIRYFYIFPKKETREVNVGVGFNHLVVKESFSQLDWLVRLDPLELFKKAKKNHQRTFAKILGSGLLVRREDLLVNHLLLGGDAGGTTDPTSGGGMGFGLLAAKMAIDACLTKEPQKTYYRNLEPLGRDLETSHWISQKIYAKTKRERKRFNQAFFSLAENVIKGGGFLSLSKIAKEVLKNEL